MNNQSKEYFMGLAIEKAKQGILLGQTPFGACIVKDNQVIACEHNTVWGNTDITAHAEINAIRIACKVLEKIDLSDCIIYSTCEPCPMCFSACHWARISRIIYGASIEDAEGFGFNELKIKTNDMKKAGTSNIEIEKGFMKEETLELFKEWAQSPAKKPY